MCEHSLTILERGTWGPHKARRICVDCGKWLKWEKTQKSHYERAKGIKYKHVVQQTKDKIAESHLHT